MDGGGGVAVPDLARILAPVTVEEFFAEYFEKRHLVVRRGAPDYYAGLLTMRDIDRVMTEQILPAGDLDLVRTGEGVPKADYTLPNGHVDAVRVARHFAEGATVILPQLHRRLPRLAAYCRALETVFSCDLQTNIYLTPADAQGFKTHYDSHDVLVLQVAGTKAWRIYETAVELPLRSQAFDPEGFEPGEMIDSFVLHPGDMAYLPRGVVHDAMATDEPSLHVTTGLLAKRWIDLLIEAVAEQGLADPAFRAAVPPGFANEGFDRAEARETFARLMAAVAERADADRALDSLGREFRDRRLPHVPGHLLMAAGAGEIGPDTEVGARPDLIARLRPASDDKDEIVLDLYGAEVAFPAFAEESLRDALSRPRVRVADLAGEIDDAGKAVLVRRLVREGAMRVFG